MTSRKRQSDTAILTSKTSSISLTDRDDFDFPPSSSSSSPSMPPPSPPPPKTKLKVNLRRYHAVARWTWNCGDGEVCGICHSAFEGVAPGVKFPGDECPVVWGKCGHSFHLQCVSTWLGSRSTCPICRRDWEFGEVKEITADADEGERM